MNEDVIYFPEKSNEGLMIVWDQMKLDDKGDSYKVDPCRDMLVQISGNPGESGRVRLEGSLDGKSFSPLKSKEGRVLELFDDSIESVGQIPMYIRPVVVSGDSDTDVDCRIFMRRSV